MEFIQRSERWLQLEDLDGEVWKDVIGYEKLYEVSSFGRIRSYHNNKYGKSLNKVKILKQKFRKRVRGDSYDARVILYNNGEEKTFLVARLVATAFLENSNNLSQVNHIDGNTMNNRIENLEWCSVEYNNNHAFNNELIKTAIKIKLINKNTGEEEIFNSMAKASQFMNKSVGYVSNQLKKGKHENEEFKWEIE